MKRFIFIVLCVGYLMISGCEIGGMVYDPNAKDPNSVVTIEDVSNDIQGRIIKGIRNLNRETEGINNGITIQPETADAIDSLKGRAKDPVTWVAVVSVLAGAVLGAKSYRRKKNVEKQ